MLIVKGLAVKNLYKSYTIEKTNYEVNKDINLSVPPASLVWIYGNSGTGKSTFLNVITGIDTPDAGSVSWDGCEINTMNVNKRAQFRLEHFGLIFQFFELIKAQTIYENAALPLKITRKSKKEIDAVLFPLFEYFDVRSLIRKKPDGLSGGEKQRVSIVRALSTNPRYIIADEITSSLDTKRSHQVYGYLRSYIKEKNGIGIFVSHDPIISEYADIVYTMQAGCLMEQRQGDC
nr:ABC transporter ATP-binding protein [uncultured Treponema sp.]